MLRLLPLLALALSTCSPPPPEVLSDVTPFLEPDGRFFAAPFPAAGRLRADGAIDVADFPTKGNSLAQEYVDALDQLGEGFSRNAAVWFPLTGAIDPASLPQSLDASMSWDSAVVLVNVDEASPEYGHFTPLETVFKAQGETYSPANLLVAVPRQGHTLLPGTWYAAALTTALRDGAGHRLPRAAFLDGAASGPKGEALKAELPRLEKLLDAQGRARTDVVAATVWRTGSHHARLEAIAKTARARPAPLVGNLTELARYPTFVVLEGHVEVPLYQAGTRPYVEDGHMVFDAAGNPVEQATEVIRFALTVPRTPMPAGGFPLLFHVPGSGGSYLAMANRGGSGGEGLAKVLAARGIGTLAVEANLTGPRHPTGDTSGFHFYNVFNPISLRDNHRQQAAEYEVLVTLAKGLSVPGSFDTEAGATDISFDPAHFFVHGHSTGSVVGASILASNDGFSAGALSGAGGSWLYNLVLKETPSSALLVKSSLGYVESDEVDIFDPILTVAATFWEPIEPMNQAPLWARDASVRKTPVSVLLFEGVKDTYYLPRMVAALGVAARMDVASPTVEDDMAQSLARVGDEVSAAPFSGNRTHAKTVTLGVVQHDALPNDDGHFVVFHVNAAKYQYGCFFASALSGTPVVAPGNSDPFAACP